MMTKTTYKAARGAALASLEAQGWTLRRELKTPHATAPDGAVRLWFRAQAVYLSIGEPHRFAYASSLHVDLRELSPEALVAKALSVARSRSEPAAQLEVDDEPDAGGGDVDAEPHADCDCWLCQRRRGCFVADSDAPMPDGWCEVQRDDCPDHASVYRFDSDTEAAAWVSRAARAVSVETGQTTALRTSEDGSAVIPASWCPGDRVRIIVPILDAIDRGLLDAAEELSA